MEAQIWYHESMKELLSTREVARLLGCPVSFIKSEEKRGRIFPKKTFPFKKFSRKDMIGYRSETNGSAVWPEFLAAGYTPDPSV